MLQVCRGEVISFFKLYISLEDILGGNGQDMFLNGEPFILTEKGKDKLIFKT